METILTWAVFVLLVPLALSLYIYEAMLEQQEKSKELRKYPLIK